MPPTSALAAEAESPPPASDTTNAIAILRIRTPFVGLRG